MKASATVIEQKRGGQAVSRVRSDRVRSEFARAFHRYPRRIPSKYLYDRIGSELFEEICRVPEYYPTRCELEILRDHSEEMARLAGEGMLIVEPGSGSSEKVRPLLDRFRRLRGYVPLEISPSALEKATRELRRLYPGLSLYPHCGDYTVGGLWPHHLPREGDHTLVFFPGSTIGNFEPHQARAFLARLGSMGGPGSLLLIGVDLRKDGATLHAAYNDAAGVTARFNKNLLARANRELGAGFRLEAFSHRAYYEEGPGRIVMELVSDRDQVVPLDGGEVGFFAGEIITTEYSYKYAKEEFRALAARAGYEPLRFWTDRRGLFGVHLLRFVGSSRTPEASGKVTHG